MTTKSVFSEQTVGLAVSGTGPVNVTISIGGHSGAFGYQPHGTAQIEYYSPVYGGLVRDPVVIGGGFGPTVISVTTGSIIADQVWAGEIRVTSIDNGAHAPGPIVSVLEWVLGISSKSAIAGSVNGVFGVPGYYVSTLPNPSSPTPLNGGIVTNVSYAPGYLTGLGIDPSRLGPGYVPVYDAMGNFVGIDRSHCFPASTPITISPTETRPISDIRLGDTVLAFDPVAELGRGALVPHKVVRLYRNTTEEWVKLRWAEGGEQSELVTTPGHHFRDRFGNFPTIEDMLENGRATVVLASGELTEVTAERSDRRMAA